MKVIDRRISKMYMELRNGQKEVAIKESILMGIKKGMSCCCLKEVEDMKESGRIIKYAWLWNDHLAGWEVL